MFKWKLYIVLPEHSYVLANRIKKDLEQQKKIGSIDII